MLIVLEGLDGAGKSTQLKMLCNYLEESGKKLKYLHFPRYEVQPFGALISNFLKGEYGSNEAVHPQLVALLFAEDRHAAAQQINEWLGEGYCVVLDRYVYSNIAFQTAKVEDPVKAQELRDWIFDLEYNYFKIPKPEKNLFLDVPINFVESELQSARSGSDRDYLQGAQDIHEADIRFQIKVREVYRACCESDPNFIRVDCADAQTGKILAPEAIFDKIRCKL